MLLVVHLAFVSYIVVCERTHGHEKRRSCGKGSEISPLSSMLFVPHLEIVHLIVAYKRGLGKSDAEFLYLVASLLCTVTNWAFQVGRPVRGFLVIKIAVKVLRIEV